MSLDGGASVGFCGITESRTDPSASYTEDCTGVGLRGRMLPRCHARVPIQASMGGVGKQKSVTAVIAEWIFDITRAHSGDSSNKIPVVNGSSHLRR
jgi:hypothetical protein